MINTAPSLNHYLTPEKFKKSSAHMLLIKAKLWLHGISPQICIQKYYRGQYLPYYNKYKKSKDKLYFRRE